MDAENLCRLLPLIAAIAVLFLCSAPSNAQTHIQVCPARNREDLTTGLTQVVANNSASWPTATPGILASVAIHDPYFAQLFPTGAAAYVRGAGAWGVRHWVNKTLLIDDDKGRIGSNSKSFTATLIAMLIDRKTTFGNNPKRNITWNTRMIDFFPTFNMTPAFRTATIKNLLNHQAGLRRDFSIVVDAAQTRVQQRNAFARALLTTTTPANAVANGSALYSNAGYILAGAIFDLVSGSTWEQRLQDWIFTPLSMVTASVGPIGNGVQNVPYGHNTLWGNNNDFTVNYGNTTSVLFMAPAGDIHMSAGDHAKWAAYHVRGRMAGGAPAACPCIPASKCINPCLSSASFSMLHTPGSNLSSYTMGWWRVSPSWAGSLASYHNGAIVGWYSEQWVMPNPTHSMSVSVMTNHWRRNQTDNSSLFPSDLVSDVASYLTRKYRLPACGPAVSLPWQSFTHGQCSHATSFVPRTRCYFNSTFTSKAMQYRPPPQLPVIDTACAFACVQDSRCLAWRFRVPSPPPKNTTDDGCFLIRAKSLTVSAAAADDDSEAGGDRHHHHRHLLNENPTYYNCTTNVNYTSGEITRWKSNMTEYMGFGQYIPNNNRNNTAPCFEKWSDCQNLCLRRAIPGATTCRGWTWNGSTKKCFLYQGIAATATFVPQPAFPNCVIASGKISKC